MINETITKEIQQQIQQQMKILDNSINKQFTNYLNTITTFISNLFNQFIQIQKENITQNNRVNSFSNFQVNKVIEEGLLMCSMCYLNDGRLVSGGERKIIIYNINSYQPDIIIDEEKFVYSVCGLKNGNLASGGGGNHFDIFNIDIREINGNNTKLIQILSGHKKSINKIIELKDGKLCSCSADLTIKIWENKNNYECIQTLEGHINYIECIIEINNYIISADNAKSIKIWDKSTYESVKTLENIYCWGNNSVSKLKENMIIIGSANELFFLDIFSFEYKSFKSNHLGYIKSICVLKDNKILIGNGKGIIHCFDTLSSQIISSQQLHKDGIYCIIENEDNKIFSTSKDRTILTTVSFD